MNENKRITAVKHAQQNTDSLIDSVFIIKYYLRKASQN